MRVIVVKGEARTIALKGTSTGPGVAFLEGSGSEPAYKLEHPQMVFEVSIEMTAEEKQKLGLKGAGGVWYETFGSQVDLIRWMDGFRAGLAMLDFLDFKWELP